MGDFVVYTIGNGFLIEQTMNAVAAIFGNGMMAGGAVVAGLLLLLFAAVSSLEKNRFDLNRVIITVIAYMVLTVPKADVVIEDIYDQTQGNVVVGNVPIGIAAPAWILSEAARVFTESYATTFRQGASGSVGGTCCLPDEYPVDRIGVRYFLQPLRAMLAVRQLDFTQMDPEVARSWKSYHRQCFEPAAQYDSQIEVDLHRSSAAFEVYSDIGTGGFSTWYANGQQQGVSCDVAGANLRAAMDQFLDRPAEIGGQKNYSYAAAIREMMGSLPDGVRDTDPGQATIATTVQAVIAPSLGDARDFIATQILRNSLKLARAGWEDSGALEATILTEAIEKDRIDKAGGATLFLNSMFYVMQAFQFLVWAFAPLILIFWILTGSFRFLGRYLVFAFWTQFFLISALVVNFYAVEMFHMGLNDAQSGTQVSDFFTLQGIDGIYNNVANSLSVANTLLAATGTLTFMLLTGSWYALGNLANSLAARDKIDETKAAPNTSSQGALYQAGPALATGSGVQLLGQGPASAAADVPGSRDTIAIQDLTSTLSSAGQALSAQRSSELTESISNSMRVVEDIARQNGITLSQDDRRAIEHSLRVEAGLESSAQTSSKFDDKAGFTTRDQQALTFGLGGGGPARSLLGSIGKRLSGAVGVGEQRVNVTTTQSEFDDSTTTGTSDRQVAADSGSKSESLSHTAGLSQVQTRRLNQALDEVRNKAQAYRESQSEQEETRINASRAENVLGSTQYSLQDAVAYNNSQGNTRATTELLESHVRRQGGALESAYESIKTQLQAQGWASNDTNLGHALLTRLNQLGANSDHELAQDAQQAVLGTIMEMRGGEYQDVFAGEKAMLASTQDKLESQPPVSGPGVTLSRPDATGLDAGAIAAGVVSSTAAMAADGETFHEQNTDAIRMGDGRSVDAFGEDVSTLVEAEQNREFKRGMQALLNGEEISPVAEALFARLPEGDVTDLSKGLIYENLEPMSHDANIDFLKDQGQVGQRMATIYESFLNANREHPPTPQDAAFTTAMFATQIATDGGFVSDNAIPLIAGGLTAGELISAAGGGELATAALGSSTVVTTGAAGGVAALAYYADRHFNGPGHETAYWLEPANTVGEYAPYEPLYESVNQTLAQINADPDRQSLFMQQIEDARLTRETNLYGVDDVRAGNVKAVLWEHYGIPHPSIPEAADYYQWVVGHPTESGASVGQLDRTGYDRMVAERQRRAVQPFKTYP